MSDAHDDYLVLKRHYESCFESFGDTHRGVDWPDHEDAITRHHVLLSCMDTMDASILDLGCGAGHLRETLDDIGFTGNYVGIDISPQFIDLCQKKFPLHDFRCGDILKDSSLMANADYILMNGLFTEKQTMDHAAMWEFMQEMLLTVTPFARRGIAFNVMSSHVDWTRDDLFHLPMDQLATFIRNNISRHFSMRQDYGLYEYMTYVFKESRRPRWQM